MCMKEFPHNFVTQNPKRGTKTVVVYGKNEPFDVYIGPPVVGATIPWQCGNHPYVFPFTQGIDGTKDEILRKYLDLMIERLCSKRSKWRELVRSCPNSIVRLSGLCRRGL